MGDLRPYNRKNGIQVSCSLYEILSVDPHIYNIIAHVIIFWFLGPKGMNQQSRGPFYLMQIAQ